MRVSVVTRKLAATDSRGARIIVSGNGQRAYYPWDPAADDRDNHVAAAVNFGSEKLGLRTVASSVRARPAQPGFNVILSTYTLVEGEE